ncbi:MAG: ABC transporter permease [Planctomycetota bacterium]
MTSYLIRRLLLATLTLLLITFVIYGLIRNMPGNALDAMMAGADPSNEIDPRDYERMAAVYGLDKPWYEAYAHWLGNVLQGDFGQSFKHRQPVLTVIGDRVGPTLMLSGTSLLLTYLLSVPLGLWSAANSGTTRERLAGAALYALYSFPAFVAALFLQLVFAVWLEGTLLELPLIGLVSDNYQELSPLGKAADRLRHLLLPVVCFTYGSLAYFSRFVKSNLEEVLRQDYIRTARAKGVGPVTVVWRHAFRNTLIPFVTLIGLTLPGLLSGSVVLETVFNWPGMGLLLLEGINVRDYPVIMGVTLVFSVLTLAGQLLADLLYAVVDPRVSYD